MLPKIYASSLAVLEKKGLTSKTTRTDFSTFRFSSLFQAVKYRVQAKSKLIERIRRLFGITVIVAGIY